MSAPDLEAPAKKLSAEYVEVRGVLAPARQGSKSEGPLVSGGEDEYAAWRDVQDVPDQA